MNEFQEQILEHYKKPNNTGDITWNPTHQSKSSNLSCGDEIEVKLFIEDNIVKEVNFLGEGCSISIAAASLFTDYIKNKSVEDVKEMNFEDLLEIIGIELTPTRQKCASLVYDSVQKAIKR